MYKYLLMLIAIFFIGCGPKYIVKKQYTPSNNASFSSCVSGCSEQKELCELESNRNYEVCLNNTYDRAKDMYENQLAMYDRAYDDYLFDLRKYNKIQYKMERKYNFLKKDYKYFNHQCVKKKDFYACDRRNIIQKEMHHMKKNAKRYPQEPLKPSLYHITRTQQSFCKQSNKCQKNFDMCYTNCGGSVVPYKFCVSNCD